MTGFSYIRVSNLTSWSLAGVVAFLDAHSDKKHYDKIPENKRVLIIHSFTLRDGHCLLCVKLKYLIIISPLMLQ